MEPVGTSVVVDDIKQLIPFLSEKHNTIIQFSIKPDKITERIRDPTSIAKIIDIIKRNNIKLILHGKYVYNFCRKHAHIQIKSLVGEVKLASQLGCDVVIHQGKNVAIEQLTKLEAITNYVKNLTEVLERTIDCESMILLETSSNQGTELGYSLAELSYIYSQFDESYKERIGICIDTCHMFVSGEVDFRNAANVTEFLTNFNDQIGLNKLKVVHLNDSSVPFNGKRDLHSDIIGGYITNPLLGGCEKGLETLLQSLRQQQQQNVTLFVFETPLQFSNHYFQRNIIDHWLTSTPLSDKDSATAKLLSDMYYQSLKNKIKSNTKI